jgi:hypothetical protein
MATNVFQSPTKSVPKDDPRILRVPFDEVQMGARKSLMPKDGGKNSNQIEHVASSRK